MSKRTPGSLQLAIPETLNQNITLHTQASSIRRNSFFSFLSSLIRLTTNFFLFVGIARLYGAEAFGQFTIAHTLSTIFILFADFGFDALLATEIARERDLASAITRRYFSMKLVFCGIATVAMLLFPSYQHFSQETQTLIYIFGFYVLFSSLSNFFFALFRGFEQLHHEMKISLATNLFLLCLLILFGVFQVRLLIVALCFVGSRFIGLLLAFFTASNIVPAASFQLSFHRWREALPQVLVFGLHFLFGNLFFHLDTILLAFWKTEYDVGIYQSVFKIAVLVLVIPDIAINSLMPVLSRLHGSSEERWSSLGRLLYKTLTFVAIPIATVSFIYAEQIINIIYGKGYGEAISVLRIFAVIILVRFAVETYALFLTTSRRQFLRMILVVLATCVNFFLNFWMIPLYGVMGAAVTSLITNILVGTGYILATRQLFARWNADLRWGFCIGCAIVSAFVLWQLKTVLGLYIVPTVLIFYGWFFYYVGYSKGERTLIFATTGK